MNLLKEKEHRKFQTISDPEKKMHLVKTYFLNKPYFVKNADNENFITGIEVSENERVIVDTKVQLAGEVVMYNMFNKYIEFRATVEENISPERYRVNIHTIHIATDDRKSKRHNVEMSAVSAGNFRVSRNAINASLFNIPTSVKVHLKQYQQILTPHADEVVVDVFDKSKEKLEMVRRSGKILYIKNTSEEQSFRSSDPEKFIDYAKSTDQEIPAIMRDYKSKKIVSELIVPVIYTGHDGIPIPLGYIQFLSKSGLIAEGKAGELCELGKEIVQKMRDANTLMVNERQKIENISNEGICLRITHPELRKFLPEQNGMTFDVIFKMTQPITLFTEVIYMGIDNEDLMVGLKIVGFSTKSSDSNRFNSLVNLLT